MNTTTRTDQLQTIIGEVRNVTSPQKLQGPNTSATSSPELTALFAAELISKAPSAVQRAIIDLLLDFFERANTTVSSKKLLGVLLAIDEAKMEVRNSWQQEKGITG